MFITSPQRSTGHNGHMTMTQRCGLRSQPSHTPPVTGWVCLVSLLVLSLHDVAPHYLTDTRWPMPSRRRKAWISVLNQTLRLMGHGATPRGRQRHVLVLSCTRREATDACSHRCSPVVASLMLREAASKQGRDIAFDHIAVGPYNVNYQFSTSHISRRRRLK